MGERDRLELLLLAHLARAELANPVKSSHRRVMLE